MKINSFILFFSFLYSTSSFANENYSSFIKSIYNESDIIKSKALELEAELLRGKGVEMYFLPKISADSKYKSDNERGAIFESKISANSLIYSTSIIDKFKEKNSKIHAAELSLLKEKESLYKSTLDNLIGIKYYETLNQKARKLEGVAIDLYNQIEGRYSSGVAKFSDVEQAKLLTQKIKTESESISKEIELLKSNIELSTGLVLPFGVELSDATLSKITHYDLKKEDLLNNLDYQILSSQANAAKSNAEQQNTFLQSSILAEEKYNNDKRVSKESYVGIQVSMNIFDLDKKTMSEAGAISYKALKSKMDFKYKELQARVKSLQLTLKSNEKEILGLEEQRKTTEMILNSQKREYSISQSSYYEMLNTQYNYFELERRISDLKTSYAINKTTLLQLSGELLKI